MSKHINPDFFYHMPSGSKVHPCRLIHKDGTIMWKHACHSFLPECEAHESHIIKTAQRLEDLNSWVSQVADLTDYLQPVCWYLPTDPMFNEGISVYFRHTSLSSKEVYEAISTHILDHETLEVTPRLQLLHFRRC